jgi:hypothetical protein
VWKQPCKDDRVRWSSRIHAGVAPICTGLLVYYVSCVLMFHKRTHKKVLKAMSRIVAAFVMAVLALNATPARSSEAATANDTARFLAGLPPSSNSPLAAYTKDPVWQQHARYFDSIFAREENAQLSKVREFSNKYLTDKHDTMLYMFSGPDFLYATSFFPNASRYVLAGLEPVGEVADLTALSRGTAKS